jgi:subtilisin family serine protease
MGELKAVTEENPDEIIDVVLELNTRYPGGVEAARTGFLSLWRTHVRGRQMTENEDRDPVPVSIYLYKVSLRRAALDALMQSDRANGPPALPTIFRAWPDYPLYPLVDRSVKTVKADAAWRSFDAKGRRIVWAVIDSGIQADHKHFATLELANEVPPAAGAAPTAAAIPAGGATSGLHRDFSELVARSQLGPPAGPPSPLTDELGHGSHVAGILAGACPEDLTAVVASSDEPTDGAGYVPRATTGRLSGMAPNCELVSLKVMRKNLQGNWITSSAAVIAALDYIRTQVNVSRSKLRIHGVNISLGCEWDPTHYAAGQSPLCQAIDELVSSGVVVVISSGNGGSTLAPDDAKQSMSLMGTVTEPGHAEQAITVGSTHRDAPTVFGVSWRSGKGPTLDGRCKPDVVAPGEWITSVAVGTIRSAAGLADPTIDPTLTYAEQSGTSMAAPHVSGVIAAFLSNRPEFIGRPQQVKALLCGTATDLGRERYAQGAGLVDAMRMLSNS